jgi:NAD(P)-dependent dehydrogenase (short-subunit alcohol dehydrogenase family)
MSERPDSLASVSDIDCTGQQALVTGSTSEIGRPGAQALGRLGAHSSSHCRDRQAGAAVVEEGSRTDADGTVVRAEFGDIDAVRDHAVAVRDATEGLGPLVLVSPRTAEVSGRYLTHQQPRTRWRLPDHAGQSVHRYSPSKSHWRNGTQSPPDPAEPPSRVTGDAPA